MSQDTASGTRTPDELLQEVNSINCQYNYLDRLRNPTSDHSTQNEAESLVFECPFFFSQVNADESHRKKVYRSVLMAAQESDNKGMVRSQMIIFCLLERGKVLIVPSKQLIRYYHLSVINYHFHESV